MCLSTTINAIFLQKLTFKMYFQESVPESNLERSRYRYVVLRYFLLDDSVEIMEPEVRQTFDCHFVPQR